MEILQSCFVNSADKRVSVSCLNLPNKLGSISVLFVDSPSQFQYWLFSQLEVTLTVAFMFIDAPNQYKMMLQIYAQRNKLSIPVYSSEREGPPHALCFKAKVTVDGHPFKSPGFYKTLKEAENAAAQVALMSFSLDAFQEASSLS